MRGIGIGRMFVYSRLKSRFTCSKRLLILYILSVYSVTNFDTFAYLHKHIFAKLCEISTTKHTDIPINRCRNVEKHVEINRNC